MQQQSYTLTSDSSKILTHAMGYTYVVQISIASFAPATCNGQTSAGDCRVLQGNHQLTSSPMQQHLHSYSTNVMHTVALTEMMRKRITLSFRPLMRTRAAFDATAAPPMMSFCEQLLPAVALSSKAALAAGY
jgi:hypothetical protein